MLDLMGDILVKYGDRMVQEEGGYGKIKLIIVATFRYLT